MTHPPAADRQPWFKQKIFWLLMAGPILVILAAAATVYISARAGSNDMVSDDYYKDGKYINMQIERDAEALKRHIRAQLLFNPEHTAAKVFVSGDFERERPLQLVLLHPAKQEFDTTIALKATGTSGDKSEYIAELSNLPAAVHWYVRLEDAAGAWRVGNKWLPKQGSTLDLPSADTP